MHIKTKTEKKSSTPTPKFENPKQSMSRVNSGNISPNLKEKSPKLENNDDRYFSQRLKSIIKNQQDDTKDIKDELDSRSIPRSHKLLSPSRSIGNRSHLTKSQKKISFNISEDDSSSGISDVEASRITQNQIRKNEKIDELLKKNELIRSKKAKVFTLLDDDEEFYAMKRYNDVRPERVSKQYKELYSKSKELRKIIEELSEYNYKLKDALEEAKHDIVYIYFLIEISKDMI